MKDKHLRKMLDLEDKHRLKHANCIENERKLLELTNEQQRKLSEAAENQRRLSDLVLKYTEQIVMLENRNSGTLLQVVDDQREAVKESAKVSSLIRELEGDKQQLLRYKRLLVQEAGIPGIPPQSSLKLDTNCWCSIGYSYSNLGSSRRG